MQKHCHYWTGVTFLLHTRKRISWLWNIQYGRQTCMSAPGKWNWRKFSLRRKTNLCISQLLIRLHSSWCQESIGYCNPATTFLVSFAVLLLLLLWLLWGRGGALVTSPPPPPPQQNAKVPVRPESLSGLWYGTMSKEIDVFVWLSVKERRK